MAASSQKSRKVKALLAGGLVLGVGAAVTLAAWTDQEWVKGTFSAGNFNVEGSTDGSTFAEHESVDKAASLSFQLNPTNLTPGDIVAAPFVLRNAAGSTYPAEIRLSSGTATGTATANLSYKIVEVADAAACTANAVGTSTFVDTTDFGATPTSSPLTLPMGTATPSAAGTATTLCVQVTAKASLKELETANAEWLFSATTPAS